MKIDDLLVENQALKEHIQNMDALYKQQLHELEAKYKEQIKLLQKMFFGSKSERFVDNPNVLYIPGLEPDPKDEVPAEIITVPAHQKRKAKATPINTISYPDDLPVETIVLDLADKDKIDAKTGAPLVKIGEEITKRLAMKPSQFFVKQIIRPKYAVQEHPDEGIKIAELPDSILSRPACDESFVADVIVKKFCDHLPLNRQSEAFTRQKVYVSRQTLSGYVNKIAIALTPLYDLMKQEVFFSGNIFVDETPVQELAPGKGQTDQGYIVAVAGGQSLNPENRFYLYFPDRKHQNFNNLLKDYKGVFHSDKYKAYEILASEKERIWAPCWGAPQQAA